MWVKESNIAECKYFIENAGLSKQEKVIVNKYN